MHILKIIYNPKGDVTVRLFESSVICYSDVIVSALKVQKS